MLSAQNRSQVATASGLDILVGIWLLISPFALNMSNHAVVANNVILGIIVGILAAVRFFGAFDVSSLSWINCILGIWVLISPWCAGFAGVHTAVVNNVIVGIIIAVLAFWSAMATAGDSSHHHPSTPAM